MRVRPPSEWQRHRVGSVAAVANLVPLVGVLTLGWNVYSLLTLYWIEGLVTVLLAAAKALFAERGSPGLPDIEPLHELREKRGGWRPLSRLPAVYPRNVPFAASILGFWTVAVLPASVLYWLTAAPVIRPSLSLLVGGVGLVITQLHEFLSDYLAGQEYADVSAQEILREPLQLGLVTLTVGLLASAGDRSGGLVLLTGIVVVKTATSVYRLVTDHTDLPVPSVLDGAFGGSHAEPRPDIDTPDGPVRGRISVDAAPVLLGSLPMVAFGFAHRSTFAILIGLAFAALTGGSVWLIIGLVFVLVVAGARIGSYYLRYGTIEYRRYEKRLVAYDTALGAVQWTAPVDSATFSIRNAIPDRLLDTGTLAVSGVDPDDRDAQLGPVTDLDATIETLELPVSDPARPERDSAVIASALLLALSFLAVPAGLAVSPNVDTAQLIGLAIGVGPIFLLPVVLMIWAALRRM
ncbi:DUF6498-containing protein [Haloplanus natans]|uniref:DUF6498-containing protein n=1 Tax=Haloplanus natans TaxID=376171 RepID=UPI000A7601EB|nr:DUF6498-containing protein [Haloplanus natans]